MQSLSELQDEFIENLHSDNKTLSFIKPTAHLTARQQLDIYYHSSVRSLQKALSDIYPVCCKLVGEDFFNAMAMEYIQQHPSSSPNLSDYGDYFAEFIAHFTHARSLVYLPDVARLEWGWHRSFHAAHFQGIDFQRLQECSVTQANQIIFLLAPESTLLTTPYPIHHIWTVNQADYVGDQIIHLENNTTYYYLIWRKHLEVRIEQLTLPEWHLLNWLNNKLTLEEVCNQASTLYAENVIISILGEMIQKAWLVDFNIKNIGE